MPRMGGTGGRPPGLATVASLLLGWGISNTPGLPFPFTPSSISHNYSGYFLTIIPFKGTLDIQLSQNFAGVSCLSAVGTALVWAHNGKLRNSGGGGAEFKARNSSSPSFPTPLVLWGPLSVHPNLAGRRQRSVCKGRLICPAPPQLRGHKSLDSAERCCQ